MPLSRAIDRHAAEIPSNPAFRIEDRVVSYGALAATARRLFDLATAMAPDEALASQIGPASRLVAITTGNHALFPAAFVAATAGRNCAALIDPALPVAVRQRLLAKLAPDLVITAEGDDLLVTNPRTTRAETLPEAAAGDPFGLPEGEDAAPFLIVFTSGTTADPKPIIRDRHSWRVSLSAGAPFFGIGPATTTYAPGPLAHGLALYAMTETLAAGGTFLSAGHFDATRALQTIQRHDVRRLVLVPTILRRLCDDAPGQAMESVEAITIAGAKLTGTDCERSTGRFPRANIREYYGASELGFVSVTGPDDSASATAVGHAFPGVTLSVRDGDGNVLPAGETGTIFVVSPLVATGYLAAGDGAGLRRLGDNATVGDLGFLETDGTLHLLGRAGGMVISGGNNIYPSEIEDILSGLPFVRAAHVFGLEHADLGMELVAVIDPADGLTTETLAAGMAKALPRYKQPRRIWLCRSMPTTTSGKVSAKTVRQWVAEGSDALERFV
jgi:long-chain acyl-CoA synthetase